MHTRHYNRCSILLYFPRPRPRSPLKPAECGWASESAAQWSNLVTAAKKWSNLITTVAPLSRDSVALDAAARSRQAGHLGSEDWQGGALESRRGPERSDRAETRTRRKSVASCLRAQGRVSRDSDQNCTDRDGLSPARATRERPQGPGASDPRAGGPGCEVSLGQLTVPDP